MFGVHACCTNNLAVTVTFTYKLTHTHTYTETQTRRHADTFEHAHPTGDLHLTPNVSFVAICWLACLSLPLPLPVLYGLLQLLWSIKWSATVNQNTYCIIFMRPGTHTHTHIHNTRRMSYLMQSEQQAAELHFELSR